MKVNAEIMKWKIVEPNNKSQFFENLIKQTNLNNMITEDKSRNKQYNLNKIVQNIDAEEV